MKQILFVVQMHFVSKRPNKKRQNRVKPRYERNGNAFRPNIFFHVKTDECTLIYSPRFHGILAHEGCQKKGFFRTDIERVSKGQLKSMI